MKINKKKASLLNIITMTIYQAITVIIGFIIPKMLLDVYGAEIHGYTSTVTTIMGYVALLNAGLSTAAIQALYKPLAENNQNKISSVLNAVNKFYIKTGIYYTIAVIILAVILPYIITGNVSTFEIVMLMLVIGGTSTLECFIYSKHRVLLQADQRLFIVNVSDSIAIILRIILQLILIKFRASIVLVQGIPLLMVIFRMIMLSIYVKKKYTYIDSKQKPDNRALSKRKSVFFHQIVGLVVNNTDVVLLSWFTNLVNVSIYSVYNLIFSHLYTLMTTVFSNGTIASFGVVFHEGKKEMLKKAFDIYEYVYYFCVSIIYSITACMILPFVNIYTSGVDGIKYVDVKLAILFIIISILNNVRVPCNTIINAAGHFKETQWRALLEAIINITISLLLLRPLGMYGLLIGTICSFLYRSFDIIIYANKKILERNVFKTLKRVLIVVVTILINITLYKLIFEKRVIETWSVWVIQSIIIGIISTINAFACGLIFEKNIFVDIKDNYINKLLKKEGC